MKISDIKVLNMTKQFRTNFSNYVFLWGIFPIIQQKRDVKGAKMLSAWHTDIFTHMIQKLS